MVILQKRVAGVSESSLQRFLLRARRAAKVRGPANVLMTNSQTMRALNRQFRGKDQATDVLSFPTSAIKNGQTMASAGEIAICAEIAAGNATRFGHSAADEVKILILHGLLHLAGFDHERDNGRMARKETRLRRLLKLPTGLIERVHARARSSSASGRKKRKSRLRTI
jgi:probable rRNA maturation factor